MKEREPSWNNKQLKREGETEMKETKVNKQTNKH